MIVAEDSAKTGFKLVSSRLTDEERAAEFKERILEASTPLLHIIDEAKAAGFEVLYQFGPNPFDQKNVITVLRILKEY